MTTFNTHALIIESEEDSTLLPVKRAKFIRAKIIQCGSGVTELLKPGDHVMCFNEGRIITHENNRGRIVNDHAIVFKFDQP